MRSAMHRASLLSKDLLMLHLRKAFAVALLSVALPAGAAAQQRAPAAPVAAQRSAAPSQEQMQQWMTELQQLHVKLEGIQARAIQDPQLQAAQNALGSEIKAAMEKADPQLPAKMQRVEALEAEAARARQAGDQAKLQQLSQEAYAIQASFMDAQNRVFQQPAVAARLEAFQTRLETRMAQVDAEAPALIKRFKELEGKLNAGMQAHQRR
jgi:chromosome segregation ATPase